MPEINGVSLPFIPVGGVNDPTRGQGIKTNGSTPKTPFEDLFKDELQKLKFSGHAQTRMTSREINMSESEMKRLETAVAKAEQKGSKESLVMFPDKAFIVSITNKTVITAVDQNNMKDNVITNIDSAVLA